MKFLLTMNLPYTRVSGGANRSNRSLCEGLVERGHEVLVLVPALAVPSSITHEETLAALLAQGIHPFSRNGVDIFNMNGVEVHAVVEPTRLRAYLIEQLGQYAPDWVLVSSEDPSQNLLEAALKVAPERVIYLAHTPQMFPFGPASIYPGKARTALIGRAAAIVVISKFVGDYINRWSGFETFLNHPPHFGAGPFPLFGDPSRGYVLMMNASSIKGLPVFVALARAFPEVEFAALPGYGTNSADRRLLESLPNVKLLSNGGDIDDIFKQTRLLLMPSLWIEGFGMAVVDAMLRAIPVLASNFGGLMEAKLGTDYLLPVRPIEVFEERLDENMLPVPVVPEQDVRPWQDALRHLLSDTDEYQRQSAEARRAAHAFVSGLSLAPFEALLSRLAERPTRPSSTHSKAVAVDQSPDTSEAVGDVAGLTPQQLALLVLQLRKKKAANANGNGSRPAAIRRTRATGELPLSFAQQRLWFLDQLEPGSTAYHIASSIRLSGQLNLSALEQALGELVRRHEILRTTFSDTDGLPRQVVSPPAPVNIPLVDLLSIAVAEREAVARDLARQQSHRLFSLADGPLLRICLVRLKTTEHVLNLTMHHIISDGWSMGVLAREVATLYEAFSKGKRSPLEELPIQYADFAHWQREWLSGERLETQLAYWKEQLKGAPALLELPTDRPRPPQRTYRGAHQSITISKTLTEALKELSRREEVTLFMTLLAAFQALLSRYSGQTDIVVGSPIAGRNRSETEELIGFFVNTLALRADFSGDPTFREALRRVREVALSAYAHQDLPFEKVLEELQPERSLSYSPLFQVMFLLQNAPVETLEVSGLKLSSIGNGGSATKFDLTLSLAETDNTLEAALEYNTDLYEEESITQMLRHFLHLLSAALSDPALPISHLPMFSEEERYQLLHGWNQTSVEYEQQSLCLHQLFEAQVERTPDSIALICEEERLTYRELDERANQLAHFLHHRGVAAESLVGVMMERSVEMVVSLLAILKAGGAYVPLDPDYPQQRLSSMLEDAQVGLLLTQARLLERLPHTAAELILVDQQSTQIDRESTSALDLAVDSENLAYTIFTSGSTGRPKGAMNSHRAITNRLLWMQQRYQLDSTDVVMQKTPFSFDVSVWEFFWPLMSGARLVMARPGGQMESEYMVELIRREGVTTLHFVPSMLRVFLEEEGVRECRSLRRVIASGEALSAAVAERFLERVSWSRLENLYGPTEAAVDVTSWECRAEGLREGVKIGRAISNVEIYVLDERMEPVGVGLTGELYISGVAVGRGYLAQPAMTAQRFIPDPHSQLSGARMYRTGDMGRWNRAGEIEYTGRSDSQVKLRGFRIELAEIETVLEQHEAVREAVVLLREDVEADQRLVAYLLPLPSPPAPPLLPHLLRSFLLLRLPDHMIPSSFILLDHLPLTSNGKLDHRALPQPDRSRPLLEHDFLAPLTLTQQLLADIYSELLRVEQVGIDDNFFELGGHSLLATQLMSRVRVQMEVELPLRAVFERATVRGLAERIEEEQQERRGVGRERIERVEREGEEVLSYAQQRLWFLEQMQGGTGAYNIPAAVRMEGELNLGALDRTMREVVRRHEVLRTTFSVINGRPLQVIHPPARMVIPLLDLSTLSEQERERKVQGIARDEGMRPFDLESGPLLRLLAIRCTETEHVLMMTMHHIISDGWSMQLLFREVGLLYQAYTNNEPSPLPPLPIQYADFALWQRQWLQGEVLDSQLSYWREQLHAAPPLLELPTDHPRPPIQSFHGASLPFALPPHLSLRLQAFTRLHHATLFISLLAAFQLLLSRYSGQADILVGSPIAGRNRSETEELIGFFVNTLVLRTQLSDELTFQELLSRVRETALSAYAHQDLPFEMLVEGLQPQRNLSHTPLFQVMFDFQDARQQAAQSDSFSGIRMSAVEMEQRAAKFDLQLSMSSREEAISGALNYNTELYEEESITQMLRHFLHLLSAALSDPALPISHLPMFSQEERQQLLHGWNQTSVEYEQQSLCLHQLFEAQVRQTPDAIALICEQERLTYRELDERANQLAHFLHHRGVAAESLVGVMMERSVEMVVTLLAILKAGGAYVPLDPDYPQQRLSSMLEDAQVGLLLTVQSLLSKVDSLPLSSVQVLCIDQLTERLSMMPVVNIDSGVCPENLAYTIFTSGSTGRPKGAMNSHRAITNRLLWMQHRYRLDSTDVVMQKTPFSFDVSVWEFFWPLMSGARLVMARPGGQMESEYMVELIRREGVTTLHFVPSMLRVFLEEEGVRECRSLRRVIASGEALGVEVQERFFERMEAELHNLYGPTEAAVDVTSWECRRDGPPRRSVPIGRAIANTRLYLLDKEMEPAAVGLTGELYIAGVAVGRGYLAQPAMTAQRFIPDPHSQLSGARMYRTGDMGRWNRAGEIEYTGRSDSQVKLRGFRIELAEIETILEQHEAVREAVVLLREDVESDQRLVAFLVAEQGRQLQTDEVRQYVRERLPDYMVPQSCVVMERMPLSVNGKVDRRALPKVGVERPELRVEYVGPRSELEEQVAGIWRRVLGVERVGVKDNFFDVGGHSLLMVEVAGRMKEEVGREVKLVELFQYPTIDTLVRHLEQKETPVFPLQSINERALKQREALNRQREMMKQRVRSHG